MAAVRLELYRNGVWTITTTDAARGRLTVARSAPTGANCSRRGQHSGVRDDARFMRANNFQYEFFHEFFAVCHERCVTPDLHLGTAYMLASCPCSCTYYPSLQTHLDAGNDADCLQCAEKSPDWQPIYSRVDTRTLRSRTAIRTSRGGFERGFGTMLQGFLEARIINFSFAGCTCTRPGSLPARTWPATRMACTSTKGAPAPQNPSMHSHLEYGKCPSPDPSRTPPRLIHTCNLTFKKSDFELTFCGLEPEQCPGCLHCVWWCPESPPCPTSPEHASVRRHNHASVRESNTSC